MPTRNAPAFDPSSPAACKRVIAQALADAGYDNRLSARTISFEDLAYGEMVFVAVHDWAPDPFFATLEQIGRKLGFRVQAS